MTNGNSVQASAAGNYAEVNGLNLYYEIHGSGEPMILLHGGFGATGMFAGLLPVLAAHRQVIAVDLQGHGRTADIDRPMTFEAMADDVVALIEHMGLGTASIVGYSLGGAVALQAAIRHPGVVRGLVVVSTPFKRDGWYPEVLAGMDELGAAAAEPMKQTPMYELYAGIAPRPDDWTNLWAKMGDLLRRDYDWSAGVAALATPTLLVFGDADSVSPAHAAEFFGLLGGGQRDGSWDRFGMTPNQLAILPGTTHYDIFSSRALASAVAVFLDDPMPENGR